MDGSGDLLGIGGVGDEDEDEIEEGKLHAKSGTLKRLIVLPALDAGLMDQMGAHVDEYVQLSKSGWFLTENS